jgi:hypothetical protein
MVFADFLISPLFLSFVARKLCVRKCGDLGALSFVSFDHVIAERISTESSPIRPYLFVFPLDRPNVAYFSYALSSQVVLVILEFLRW